MSYINAESARPCREKEVEVPIHELLGRIATNIGEAMADPEAAQHFDMRRLALARTKCEEAAMWMVAAERGECSMCARILQHGAEEA